MAKALSISQGEVEISCIADFDLDDFTAILNSDNENVLVNGLRRASDQIKREHRELLNAKNARSNDRTTKSNKNRPKCLIESYFDASPEAYELFFLWTLETYSSNSALIAAHANLLAAIVTSLKEISSSYKVGSPFINRLLREKLNLILSNLNDTKDPVVESAFLNLLESMVRYSRSCARELSRSMRLSEPYFRRLLTRKYASSAPVLNISNLKLTSDSQNVEDFKKWHWKPDVRHRCISLLYAFMESGDIAIQRQLLTPVATNYGLSPLQQIFCCPLEEDSKQTALLILKIIENYVIFNYMHPRKTRVLYLNSSTIDQLKAAAFKSHDSTVQKIANALLLTLFSDDTKSPFLSTPQGSKFSKSDRSSLNSQQHNGKSKHVLNAIQNLPVISNENARHFLFSVLTSMPDLVSYYFGSLPVHVLEPKPNLQCIQMFAMITEIIRDIPLPGKNDLVMVSGDIVSHVIPNVLSKRELTKGVLSSNSLLQATIINFIIAVLNRSAKLMDLLSSKLQVEFRHVLHDRVPEVQTLLSLRTRLDTFMMKPNDTLAAEKVEYKERCQYMYSRVLVLLRQIAQLLPSAMHTAGFDFLKLLPSAEALVSAPALLRRELLLLLSQVKVTPRGWIAGIKGGADPPLEVVLRLMLIASTSDEQEAAHRAALNGFLSTGLFSVGGSDATMEAMLWIDEVTNESITPLLALLNMAHQDPYGLLLKGIESAETNMIESERYLQDWDIQFSPVIISALYNIAHNPEKHGISQKMVATVLYRSFAFQKYPYPLLGIVRGLENDFPADSLVKKFLQTKDSSTFNGDFLAIEDLPSWGLIARIFEHNLDKSDAEKYEKMAIKSLHLLPLHKLPLICAQICTGIWSSCRNSNLEKPNRTVDSGLRLLSVSIIRASKRHSALEDILKIVLGNKCSELLLLDKNRPICESAQFASPILSILYVASEAFPQIWSIAVVEAYLSRICKTFCGIIHLPESERKEMIDLLSGPLLICNNQCALHMGELFRALFKMGSMELNSAYALFEAILRHTTTDIAEIAESIVATSEKSGVSDIDLINCLPHVYQPTLFSKIKQLVSHMIVLLPKISVFSGSELFDAMMEMAVAEGKYDAISLAVMVTHGAHHSAHFIGNLTILLENLSDLKEMQVAALDKNCTVFHLAPAISAVLDMFPNNDQIKSLWPHFATVLPRAIFPLFSALVSIEDSSEILFKEGMNALQKLLEYSKNFCGDFCSSAKINFDWSLTNEVSSLNPASLRSRFILLSHMIESNRDSHDNEDMKMDSTYFEKFVLYCMSAITKSIKLDSKFQSSSDTCIDRNDIENNIRLSVQLLIEVIEEYEQKMCLCVADLESISTVNEFFTAALKHRIDDSLLMDCVRCIVSFLGGDKKKFFGRGKSLWTMEELYLRLVSHSNFALAVAGDGDMAEPSLAILRLLIVLLPYLPANSSANSSVHANVISLLLKHYNGSVSPRDILIIRLIYLYQKAGSLLSKSVLLKWTSQDTNQDQAALSWLSGSNVILRFRESIRAFPLKRSLIPSRLPFEKNKFKESVDNVMEMNVRESCMNSGNNVADLIFDPSFILPLIEMTLSSKKSNAIYQACAVGVVSYCIVATSSLCDSTRAYAFSCLQVIYEGLESFTDTESQFKSRSQALLALRCIKDGVVNPMERLSSVTAISIALGVDVIISFPGHDVYPAIGSYLLSNPWVSNKDLPFFTRLMNETNTSEEQSDQSRLKLWALRSLRDGIRTNQDVDIAASQFVIPLLLSSIDSLTGSKEELLVLEVLQSFAALSSGVSYLVKYVSVLSWINIVLINTLPLTSQSSNFPHFDFPFSVEMIFQLILAISKAGEGVFAYSNFVLQGLVRLAPEIIRILEMDSKELIGAKTSRFPMIVSVAIELLSEIAMLSKVQQKNGLQLSFRLARQLIVTSNLVTSTTKQLLRLICYPGTLSKSGGNYSDFEFVVSWCIDHTDSMSPKEFSVLLDIIAADREDFFENTRLASKILSLSNCVKNEDDFSNLQLKAIKSVVNFLSAHSKKITRALLEYFEADDSNMSVDMTWCTRFTLTILERLLQLEDVDLTDIFAASNSITFREESTCKKLAAELEQILDKTAVHEGKRKCKELLKQDPDSVFVLGSQNKPKRRKSERISNKG